MMQWEKLLAADRSRTGKTPSSSVDATRTEFEIDYDRIVFSAPFRNLQDKTQVFPLPEHDFVHTRLTHSLEVSSVGRSLGKAVGDFLLEKYPSLGLAGIEASDIGAVVSAAALTHDIGNPPFGHAGEDAISDFFKFHPYGLVWKEFVTESEWSDLRQFEGNAQGFRMLLSKVDGLKLSPATVAAFTKYPRPSLIQAKDNSRRSQKKYGFFSNQKADYADLAERLGIDAIAQDCYLRHPLAFLVEAADDICYSIIDLEDGCTLGLLSLDEAVSLLAPILGAQFKPEKLHSYSSQTQKLGILRAMCIRQLVRECVDVFIQKESDILSGVFDQSLTDHIPSSAHLSGISEISVRKIYRSKPVLEKEAAGFQVLEGLMEVFAKALYHRFYKKEKFSGQDKSILRLLPDTFELEGWGADVNPYPLLRSVTDFISGMTDKHALSLYRRVKGISLPGA